MTTFDKFYEPWKHSAKGNYYGDWNNYIYVISNIDHDTKIPIDHYDIVRTKKEKKDYHLVSCGFKTLEMAKDYLYRFCLGLSKPKLTKFDI